MLISNSTNNSINSATSFKESEYWENTVIALYHLENNEPVFDSVFSDTVSKGKPLDNEIETYFTKGVSEINTDSPLGAGKALHRGLRMFILKKVKELKPGESLVRFGHKLSDKYLSAIPHEEGQFLAEVTQFYRRKSKSTEAMTSFEDSFFEGEI